MRLIATSLALAGLVAVSACTPGARTGTASATTGFKLALSHVAPLTRAQGHYTLWAGTSSSQNAVQSFLVDAGGALTTLDGKPWDGTATVATNNLSLVFVTLQAPDSTDQQPSKQEFLRGTISNGTAALSLSASFASGALEAATGHYILNDASTDDTTDSNGVCFMDQHRQAGLVVPPPPDGWAYETWINLDGHMLPLGKFVDPASPDDWNGYSLKTPPFPGEDFNQNLPAGIATGFDQPNLRGAELLVTVERASLRHEEVYPSPIRVLSATIPTGAAQNQSYGMFNVAAAGLPAGTASILP